MPCSIMMQSRLSARRVDRTSRGKSLFCLVIYVDLGCILLRLRFYNHDPYSGNRDAYDCCQVVKCMHRGLREQGGEASKAAGSELIVSLCKAGDRMEALKVYEDMTSPLPAHPQHKLHPTTQQGVSKSAAKRQRAKQRQQQQEAGVATAVAPASTAVMQELAGSPVSDAKQAVLASSYSQQDTAQPEPLQMSHEPARFIPAETQHTAQDLPDDSVDGAKSVPPAANDDGRTSDTTDAHSHPPPTPASLTTEMPGTQSGTHPDMLREPGQHDSQATSSELSSSHSRKPSTAEAASSDSSSSNGTTGAAQPAAQILMSKPGRRTQPEIAEASASTGSAQASDAAQHHSSVDASHFSNSTQDEGPYRMDRSPQDPSGNPSNRGGVGLGSSGARGRGGQGAAQAESSLGNRPLVPASSDSSGHGRLVNSLKLSQKAICFPSIGATAALVHAFASADDIHHCFR